MRMNLETVRCDVDTKFANLNTTGNVYVSQRVIAPTTSSRLIHCCFDPIRPTAKFRHVGDTRANDAECTQRFVFASAPIGTGPLSPSGNDPSSPPRRHESQRRQQTKSTP